jgi:uncharacterized protein (DUF362 family)
MTTPVSVIQRPGIAYPDAETAFAPHIRYPELRDRTFSPRPNAVYQAVRDCLEQLDLDPLHLGASQWNPLGRYIQPGQKVFALCNLVHHRRPLETEAQFAAKCTHASIVRAVVDYALIAAGPRGEVVIGNAPLQSCDFEAVVEQTGLRALADHYRRIGAPVRLADLRCYTTRVSMSGARSANSVRRLEDAVSVDLGSASLLAALGPEARFAVSDYNPEETRRYHSEGRHTYVVHREILDSDVIIGIPKLKVHEKVGLTCALKNFVGTSAIKQSLPHHRIGSPEAGGDEHPPGAAFSSLSSMTHEWASRQKQNWIANTLVAVGDRTLRRACSRFGGVLAGAWDGNDTAWRMVCDLVRIAEFADGDGALRQVPQRKLLTFTDGIVAGEGNGPLAPDPVDLGIVSFSDDPALSDWASSELAGFDARRIPLVAHSLRERGLDPASPDFEALIDGALVPIARLRDRCRRPLLPPPGWRSLELRRAACS